MDEEENPYQDVVEALLGIYPIGSEVGDAVRNAMRLCGAHPSLLV